VSALSSWIELAVGLACLTGAWGAWRRAIRAASLVLTLVGVIAIVHAVFALAS
jgi:hypothetical protein